jgi:hypothetical protein
MIKIDATNVIPKRLGTYLLGVIPGLVFELSVAFGEPNPWRMNSGFAAADRLRGMPDKPQMTMQQAKRYFLKWKIAIFGIILTPVALSVYGLAHSSRHKVLLLVVGVMGVPAILAIVINTMGRGGLLNSTTQIEVTSLGSLLKKYPGLIFTAPVLLIGLPWLSLLACLWVKSPQEYKPWLQQRTVTVIFWLMTPVITLAYLCIGLGKPWMGGYIASCMIYITATIAVWGLQLEGGVVKFFGTYKTQASPLVILSMALFCCLAFGALHYALWTIWPPEYVNLHGVEDAIYFSVVTMATVGYGDILPVGHIARWLCVAEIVSGVMLLVIGVSASMTVWLQVNQPKGASVESVETTPLDTVEQKSGQG